MTELIARIILAYLLGSVSGSLLIGRLRNVDIREQGSGNAGGTNAFRTQGWLFALGVVIIDVGKGLVAARWIAALPLWGVQAAPGPDVAAMACGFAAVLGHCFPVYHGFRGGKGAGTALGALLVIQPWLILPMVLVWLITLVLSGYVGLATVLAGFSLVPAAWWLGDTALLVFTLVLALFLLFMHRSNVQRLLNGTENRFERARLFRRRT
ncbi:MAG: glycerol-3-phosphate 1-O-acyltransferase PlsY [Lysobacterales bacterium]|jgi:glycerol-3-phosphate acyltransferase PlsY